jgi:Protein of unknown function (DUF1353)
MKRLLGLAIVVFAVGCQVIPPPTLKPFADSHDWMLVEDLTYHIGDSQFSITVPRGFVTDFASIPQPLWSFGLSPYGRYSKAAIIHDYLYWTQDCTREQADRILLVAMKESGVGKAHQVEIYQGVHLGGKSSWEANRKQREQMLPRVIPARYRDFPGDAIWSEYRQTLVSDHVHDPDGPRDASYCTVGDSAEVPQAEVK